MLLIERKWRTVALLVAAWLSVITVIANSRGWVLPGSFLLYPERTLYWVAPLCAVCIALAWRAIGPRIKATRPMAAMSIVALLGVGAYFHNHFCFKLVKKVSVTADGWEALVWAKHSLRSEIDLVDAPYDSTGSWLPSVAQISCNGSHNHHFIGPQVAEYFGARKVTHTLIDRPTALHTLPAGTVVFHNSTVVILKLDGDRK